MTYSIKDKSQFLFKRFYNIAAIAFVVLFISNYIYAGNKKFSGTWVNEKYNSKGVLECVAKDLGNGKWSAEFTGEFRGDDFEYNVVMNGQEKGSKINFDGTANVDGDEYQWTGYISGNKFYGEFKARSGNYGTFELKKS